jgi:predicted flavoprotein YhiN
MRRCGKQGGSVLLLDANDTPGKKILATGNGRCNLSNTSADGWENTRAFFESLGMILYTDADGRAYPMNRQASSVRDALVREASGLGAAFMTGTRVTAVRRGDDDDFVIEAVKTGDAGVLPKSAKRDKSGVLAQREAPYIFKAKQVIVATGGKASPKYGNLGDGYAIARSLGIGVNPIRPALAPFLYSDAVRRALSVLAGVRARAKVALIRISGDAQGVASRPMKAADHDDDFDDKNDARGQASRPMGTAETVMATSEGEVQFADDGLSGICIFDLSRYYKKDSPASSSSLPVASPANGMADGTGHSAADGTGHSAADGTGHSNIADGTGHSAVDGTGHSNIADGTGHSAADGMAKPRADDGYAVYIDFAPNHTEEEIAGLLADGRAAGLSGVVHTKIAAYLEAHGGGAESVKRFTVSIKGTKGWKEAQVTAGGVNIDEVDLKYYESKAVPGLYIVGEALDYDGPSGGYNLDFAWDTGQKAGRAAGAYTASYLKQA